jgi:ribosomal protein S18 acetylase RimI-like enzyme
MTLSSQMHQTTIRPMTERDVPQLLRLMKAIVDFEGGTDFSLTADDLIERGFGTDPEFGAFVADPGNGQLLGMAVHYTIPFTHTGRPQFMLKWLYVDPSARSHGVGRLLMDAIIRHAQQHGYDRVAWFVLKNNKRAQEFYRGLGAVPDPDRDRWLLPTNALHQA